MISNTFILSALTAIGVVAALGPAAVNLRTAANYAILAETGVTTVPASGITGAVAVSPIGAAAMTGFSLILDSTGQFSTSSQVTGHLFAADYTTPTPSTLTIAIADMGTAFTDAIGRTGPDFTNLATAWIFQVAGTLTIANSVKMILLGAHAANIVWVVADAVTAGTNSHLEGVFLGKTGITLQTGATANSRLLAQTLVALQEATVTT
ncbi:antifreeze protein [Mycena vulgaris]|nr:antifreeze protein [Mycena vulgaris]